MVLTRRALFWRPKLSDPPGDMPAREAPSTSMTFMQVSCASACLTRQVRLEAGLGKNTVRGGRDDVGVLLGGARQVIVLL